MTAARSAARSGASFDKDYTLRLARAHEENGWDRVLFAYGSGSPDPNAAAAYIASKTEHAATPARAPAERLLPDVRRQDVRHHRPDQRRPGDRALHHRRHRPRAAARGRLPVPRRAVRAHPGVHGDRQAGMDVARAVRPRRAALQASPTSSATSSRCSSPGPGVSFGGSSPAAYQAGGAEADIYCLWGEPLASTAEQIESVKAAARAAGRTDVPEDPGRVPPDQPVPLEYSIGWVTCTVCRHGGCNGGWLAGCCSRSLTC